MSVAIPRLEVELNSGTSEYTLKFDTNFHAQKLVFRLGVEVDGDETWDARPCKVGQGQTLYMDFEALAFLSSLCFIVY
jgi:hypothetical protein